MPTSGDGWYQKILPRLQWHFYIRVYVRVRYVSITYVQYAYFITEGDVQSVLAARSRALSYVALRYVALRCELITDQKESKLRPTPASETRCLPPAYQQLDRPASITPTFCGHTPHRVNVITSGQSNLTKKAASQPHTDGSIVFARWHQCAPMVSK